MQKSNVLPSEYQQIAYIESSGTQWLDTGVVPTEQTITRFKFQNKEVTGNLIFGFFNTEYYSYRLFNYGSNVYFDLPTGNRSTYRIAPSTGFTTGKIYANTDYEVELGNHYVIVDGERGGRDSPVSFSGTITKTLTLNNYNNSSYSKNRWYWIKILEGQTLIRDMIPCVRISDSEPGLYDFVSKAFFTNSGTGTFIIPT